MCFGYLYYCKKKYQLFKQPLFHFLLVRTSLGIKNGLEQEWTIEKIWRQMRKRITGFGDQKNDEESLSFWEKMRKYTRVLSLWLYHCFLYQMFRPFSSAFQQQNGLPLASHLRSLHAKLMHLHVLVSFVYKHCTFGHYTVFPSKKSIIHSTPFLHCECGPKVVLFHPNP